MLRHRPVRATVVLTCSAAALSLGFVPAAAGAPAPVDPAARAVADDLAHVLATSVYDIDALFLGLVPLSEVEQLPQLAASWVNFKRWELVGALGQLLPGVPPLEPGPERIPLSAWVESMSCTETDCSVTIAIAPTAAPDEVEQVPAELHKTGYGWRIRDLTL